MRSIALLTPYTGDNLGDGAIQEAMIHNIRARWPEVRITGLTLSPEQTAKLHGVPCRLLTNLSIRYFSSSVAERHRGRAESHVGDAEGGSGLKRALRRVPWAFTLAKSCYLSVRRIVARIEGVALHARHAISELLDLPHAYRLVRGLDLLVASGGGQIDDIWGGAWGHPYAMLKWALLARLAKTPFVILSVGVGELGSRTSRVFMRRALRSAAYRSYRDEGSRQLLAAMPFTALDPVCPDLALSYPIGPGAEDIEHSRAILRIGINPISYLRSGSWPVASDSLHGQYLGILAAFIEDRLREGHEVVLFPGDRGDHHVIADLSRRLHESLPAGLRERLSTPAMTTAAQLIGLLRSFDIVVASRLHSVILAHLVGVPVLAISYERKVRTQMDAFGQSAYCLDIHRLAGADLDAGFERLRGDRKYVQDQLRDRSRQANAEIQSQYDLVLRQTWQR
jgi:polysaccharide pyruvyl transferase WcaK-like protein